MKVYTKYTPGNTVWVMIDNKAKEALIQGMDIYVSSDCIAKIYYILAHYNGRVLENEAYSTKEELLKSL